MKLKTLLSMVLLISFFITHAQKEIPLFTASSKKPTRPIAGVAVTSAMEMKVLKAIPHDVYRTVDDGIVVLAGDEVYKYNPDYSLAFKSDISNMLKFPRLGATTMVVSDNQATYILEIKDKSKEKASVIYIDPKGSARQQSYQIDINQNMDYGTFIVNGKLCVLGSDIDKSKDKVVYKYYYVNPSDNKLTSKSIDLPTDDYEYQQIKKEAVGYFYWRHLATHGENAILIKAYFKQVKGSKKYSFVCQLLEVDMQGNVSAQKSITFEPKLAGDDREFVTPRIIFNKADESVYFVGYMQIDKNKINGLYLLKYDYNTASLIYNKEFAFNDLMKPEIKKNADVHYSIPENVGQYYPLQIRREDVLIDNVNNFFNVRIITDFGMKSTTFFEVTFDKYGDHIKTVVTEYDTFINYYNNYVINPTSQQLVWVDKTRPHVASAKPGPWDFIYKQAADKKNTVLWIPVSTPKGNSLIKYDTDVKKFVGVLLN